GRDAVEKWHEAVGARFLTDELAARPAPDDEKFFPVFAREWRKQGKWTGSEMDWFRVALPQPAGFLGQLPNAALCRKEEILAICRPDSTTFGGRIVPTGQKLMCILAGDGDFPECSGIGFLIFESEAQDRSVRRPKDVSRPAGHGG